MKQKLFNPFIQIAGFKALLIGGIFLLFSSTCAALLNTRFDGVLDVHFTNRQPFYISYLDSLINVIVLSFVLYVFGIILSKGKTRIIDIIGTISLARFPMLLIPFLNIQNQNSIIGEKIIRNILNPNSIQLSNFDWIYLIFTGIISILILIWYITLLFKAYKISTNLKGANLIVSFILGIIISEILSKIIIYKL